MERHTVVVLGGEMPSVATFCIWDGATCNLKPGTFGGTEKMSLRKTTSGLISQFDFYYGVLRIDAAEAQIDDYTRVLGKPSRDSINHSGDFVERELEWSDAATTFQYRYRTNGRQAEASAMLLDNALAGPVH